MGKARRRLAMVGLKHAWSGWQGEGALDGGVLSCACLVVSDIGEGAGAWGRHVGGLQW